MAPPLSTLCWVVDMFAQPATKRVAAKATIRSFFISSPFVWCVPAISPRSQGGMVTTSDGLLTPSYHIFTFPKSARAFSGQNAQPEPTFEFTTGISI
jgi:hypothetical protein